MKTVPTLVTALSERAREIYGSDLIAASICYQIMVDGRARWQGHICVMDGKSIFCDAATPAAAFDATMARMDLDSLDNISRVLGYNVAA